MKNKGSKTFFFHVPYYSYQNKFYLLSIVLGALFATETNELFSNISRKIAKYYVTLVLAQAQPTRVSCCGILHWHQSHLLRLAVHRSDEWCGTTRSLMAFAQRMRLQLNK